MRVMFMLVFAAMATLSAFNVNAATFVVNTTADTQDAAPGNGSCADSGGACSLRAAITEANALAGADIITVPAGTYTQSLAGADEDANAGGDLDITSPITINGAGAATVIQGNALPNVGTERVFHVVGTGATSVTINSVTIENGHARDATDGGRGGGIKVGGGVTADSSINFTLTDAIVRNNLADTRGGGISVNKGNTTITNCAFTGNVAGSALGTGGAGGAILIDSQDNLAVPGQVATITNTLMDSNRAESSVANTFGGAVIVRALDAVVTFENCVVTNNVSNAITAASFSGFAGGLYNQQAHMIVRNTVVSGNSASHFHAGIRNLASTAAAATLDIINSSISNNFSAAAAGQGGGITNILGGTFDATLNIDHSTISGNTLTGATSIGGGLINTGSAGGAALLNMVNSTVSGNSAADIGGVYSDGSAATCIVDYSTVSNNSATNVTAPEGGGIYQDTTAGGSTFVSNSISANNVAGTSVDINDLAVSLDYNHIENPNPAWVPSANDVVGSDPNIGSLANNGGPTFTHAPNAGSPVLNTIPSGTGGCGNPIVDDQRGQVRPAGGSCDKGSVEGVGGGGPTPTFTNTPQSTPTNTNTNTPTATATNTSTPANTPTFTATTQFTPTNTNTNTPTPTATFTSTPANTPTFTATSQFTPTSTNTATPTNTPTVGPTATFTATSQATATATATGTPMAQTFENRTAICANLGTAGAPYPSQITVTGGPTQIGAMKVVFFDFWHQLPDNFDALLVGPGGQEYVLMGDAGGAIPIDQGSAITLTFADFTLAVLPDSGPLLTGETEPTNWESPVSDFPAPAPAGPYVEPGNVPLGPIGTTMFGTFGFTNANGVWSLYIRDDGGALVNPSAITGCLDTGWQLQFLPLTAAPASISGRVTTSSGNGLRNAKVVVTGGTLTQPVIATTGSMGYYSIDGLETGQTYLVTVNSKRYTFSMPTRVISLVDNIVDADFIADPQQ